MEGKAVDMKVITQTILIFTLYCSLLTNTAHADTCPPKELLEPCICEQDKYIMSIRCTNITKMETLVDVFHRSADRRFKYFSLDHSSLMYLPATSLETKRFKGLLIANATLTSLFDRVPSVSNDLELMVLVNASLLRGICWDQFENLSKLTVLQITKTEVKSVGKSFSKNVGKKLTTLYLFQTKTLQIDDRAFESLTELRDLRIAGNKVKTLKRSMFSRPSAIENFLFSENEIESLPEDIFSDMSSLRVVSFRNNKISKFTETTFGGIYDKLVILEFQNNPINCDCSIEWYTSRNERRKVLGACAEPLDKKGRRIGDISKEDMDYCHESKPREINSIEAIFRS